MSRRPRPLALPWVLLCLVAYLGSAAHFVLVQHRACLEHGEWVHAQGATQARPPAQEVVSFAEPRLTGTEATPSAEGVDEHCAQAFLRRAITPPQGDVSPLLASAPEGSPGVAAPGLVPPPVAWLRLAPKASPPRV